jgi:hypothetical protein
LQRILQGISGARESIGSPAAGGAVNETPSFPSLQERVPSLFREGDTSDVAPILEEDLGESSGLTFDLRGLGPNNQAMTEFQENFGVEDTGPNPSMEERARRSIPQTLQDYFKVSPGFNAPPAPSFPSFPALEEAAPGQDTGTPLAVPEGGAGDLLPPKPQTPEVPVAPQGGGAGAGGAGGAGGMSSFEQELMSTLDRREKAAEQDKWLALAQVGLNMMSSTQPTLLGAVGEAGLKGVEAARGARDQYEKDRLELLAAMEKSRMTRAAAAASAARGAQGAAAKPISPTVITLLEGRRDAAVNALAAVPPPEPGGWFSGPTDPAAGERTERDEELRRIENALAQAYASYGLGSVVAPGGEVDFNAARQ